MTQTRDWKQRFAQLFDENKGFVEELIKENEALRKKVALLRQELAKDPGALEKAQQQGTSEELAALSQERDRLKAELAQQKGSTGDLAKVYQERDRLKAEFEQQTLALEQVTERMAQVEQENAEFAERFLGIEKESSNLASLYVASYQLHSSLEYEVVLRRINEILINLIGAERFAIYLFDAKANAFTLVDGEGVDERKGGKIPLADNFLSRVARSKELYLAKDVTTLGDDERPIAALPLIAADELLGLLVVYKLLIQKDSFESIDMELFDLLAGHAAIALRAAQLYSRSQRKASTLEGFLQMLKNASAEEASNKES